MEFTTLGRSNLKVSKVCLGTMTFGQQNSEAEACQLLDFAFNEYGINFLDTAEMYPIPTKESTQGATDRIIGKWLKSKDRSKIVLATKVCGYGGDRLMWMPGRNGKSPRVSSSEIFISVEESLKRLQTDYIDLLQIHWPDRYVPLFGAPPYDMNLEREAISFEEQLEALNELVKSGKVRYAGVSNETPYGLMRFMQLAETRGLIHMVSIQNSYSLLVRSDFESGLTEVCSPRNEHVSLLAFSPLAGGILTGKYAQATPNPSSRFNLFPGYMERYQQSLAQAAVAEYVKVAEKARMTPTELALGFCYTRPHVASTIIGATTLSQLRENLKAWEKRSGITPEILAEINAVYKRFRDPATN